MRIFASTCLIPALIAFSSCTGPGAKKLTDTDRERLDEAVKEAMWQYDEGQFDTNAYNKAYQLTSVALEIDPDDLQAKLIRGWVLLQSGRYDPWLAEESGNELQGAKQVFAEILEASPNEFKAKQGLAAIHFKQYHEFARKVELLERISSQFQLLIDMLPTLDRIGASATDREFRDRTDLFSIEWGKVNEAYRRQRLQPFQLFEHVSMIEPAKGKPWAEEELDLDQISYFVNRGMYLRAEPLIKSFVSTTKARAVFWEEQGLESLGRAQKIYQELERDGSNYYLIKHDLALVHMALGEFFLRKALADAEKEFARLRPDVKLERTEKNEVIASFFADKTLHKNPRREIVEAEFAAARDKIIEFIEADELAEKSALAKVDRARLDFTSRSDQNAVLADVLGNYESYSKDVMRESRVRRKTMILNLLVILIYPQYMNQDLTNASNWALSLSTVDIEDRIAYFIKGVIYEKQGKLEEAIGEFERFLTHTSPVTEGNRRDYVRTRMRLMQNELARKRVEAGGR